MMNDPASSAAPGHGPGGHEPFDGAAQGQHLGPLSVAVSATANERYWAAAGVDHPARRAGALYPPMAANLSILLFRTITARALLQTAQRLVCHDTARAPAVLTITGAVTDRFAKRGREYVSVQTLVAHEDGTALWSSTATFCELGP